MLVSLIFLSVLSATHVGGKLQTLVNNAVHKIALSRCVLRAIDCCVDHGETVTVVVHSLDTHNDSTIQFEQILFEDLGSTNKVTYNIKKTVRSRPIRRIGAFGQPPGMYIVHVKGDLSEVSFTLKMLSREPDWSPHAKFLLVCSQVFKNFDVEAERARRYLFGSKLMNCIGFVAEGDDSPNYDIYRLHLDGQCGYNVTPMLIDRCVNGDASKDWFEDYLPKDLKGCKLEVKTSIIEPFVIKPADQISDDLLEYNFTEGLEVKLLNTIAEYSNITIHYSVSTSEDVYGKFFPNGTFTASYKDLADKKIDLIMGYVVSRPETQAVFDTISSYFQDSLIFCVTHAKLEDEWITAAKIFNSWPQFASIGIYIVLAYIIRCYSNLLRIEIGKYKNFTEIIFAVFNIHFGGAESLLPRTSAVRSLVLSGVIFSFFFRTVYVSFGIRQLFTPMWGYQVHTDREVAQKIVQYYPLCLNYFAGELSKIRDMEFCEDYLSCLTRSAESEKYATCMPKLNVRYLFRHFFDAKGHPRLFCFDRNIASYPIEMLMWKGHPLKPRINDLVNRLSAGGFVSVWEKEIFDNLRANSKINTFGDSAEMILKISHLFSGLMACCCGHVLAMLVFVVEIVIFNYGKRKQQQRDKGLQNKIKNDLLCKHTNYRNL